MSGITSGRHTSEYRVTSVFDPRTDLPPDAGPRLATTRVCVPVTDVRRDGADTAPIDTQLIYGEVFYIHREAGDWVWGQAGSFTQDSAYKGYIGYVRRTDLGVDAGQTHRVITLNAPVFAEANIKSRVLLNIPLNGKVHADKCAEADFLHLSTGGYVHTRHVANANAAYMVDDYVNVAERFLGLPYIWGGMSTRGVDCSALVLNALRATGRDGPRDTDQQETYLGTALAGTDDIRRGDLVFWKGHVGIMVSATDLLHANAFHMSIEIEPLGAAITRIKKAAGTVTSIRRL